MERQNSHVVNSVYLSSSDDEPFSDDDSEECQIDDEQLNKDFTNQDLQQQVEQINKQIEKNTQKRSSSLNIIKVLVSKQKRRFQFDGFCLDLAYITNNIIAMGYPAEKMESLYRNSMSDVVKFFNQRHQNNYKIYNLCSEKQYDKKYFDGRVEEFGFDDHNSPPFHLIYEFCTNLDLWLKESPEHVAAIHCKAGKGRTGVMICCYLLYSNQFSKATQALQYYGMIRTKNKKSSIQIF